MRIGIIGGGTVGRATARVWLEHCGGVRVYDTDIFRRTHILDDVLACDLVFLCLPTPQKPDSLEADVSAIDQFCYSQCKSTNHFVLRSTVPVGTTEDMRCKYGLFNLVYSPEFLTARCATTDAQLPARNIIGAPLHNTCAARLQDLYERRFPGVPCLRMSTREAEAVKLLTNAFFAVKLAYFNEVRAYCDMVGLKWDVVLAGVLADGRIAHSHTQVPGPDGKRGYGGACLPKDLANLISCINKAEVNPWMCKSAYERNRFDRQDKE